MNILLLCPKLPYPPTDGGRIAIYEPLRRLAERGHEITLLSLCRTKPSEEILSPLRRYCAIKAVEHDTRNRLLPAALNLFSHIPYTISKYISPSLALTMRKHLEKESCDIVQLENLHMAHYHSISRNEFHIPTILRQHNVESLLAERYAKSQKGLLKVYTCIHAAKLKQYELDMCSHMDLCVTITQEDADELMRLNRHIRTVVVPAGIDADYYSPDSRLEEDHTIVSVGSMDWPPNVDALVWFCREIFPKIQKNIPKVLLYIVGKSVDKSISNLEIADTVFVTGFVDDVRPFYAKGTVFIVPLRSGGGMRLKILEAMAMGKAIVSTTIGAEGIRVTHGQDILLADDPASFADSVCLLLKDPDLRKQLGHNARKLVVSRYTWEQSVELLEKAYEKVVRR